MLNQYYTVPSRWNCTCIWTTGWYTHGHAKKLLSKQPGSSPCSGDSWLDKKVTSWLSKADGLFYGTAVTTCSAVAPNPWTPSFPRETSVLWLNSHLSHAFGSKLGEKSSKPVAINIKTCVTILWWTKREHLKGAVPVGTMDVEYTDTRIGVLTNCTTGNCI